MTPSPLTNLNSDIKGYSRIANVTIGIGEIILGVVCILDLLAAGGIEVATEGVGSYYAGLAIVEGYAAGSIIFAYGISRLAGSNNQKFKDDIVGTFVPPEVDVANNMNEYTKNRGK